MRGDAQRGLAPLVAGVHVGAGGDEDVHGRDLGGRTGAEVILAGEKYPHERDYYLERREFDRMVDPFRHGQTKGSNYLFIDGHVELQLPREIMRGIDPWDVVR